MEEKRDEVNVQSMPLFGEEQQIRNELMRIKKVIHISIELLSFLSPFLFTASIRLCSNSGMFKLMLIPELVRKRHSFHSSVEWKRAGWKMSQPKKIWGRTQSECDPEQTLSQPGCRDTNHQFSAIRILLITSRMTGFYLDLCSVISNAENMESLARLHRVWHLQVLCFFKD